MLTLQAGESLVLTTGSAVSTDYIAELESGQVLQGQVSTATDTLLVKAGGRLVRLIIVAVGGGQAITLRKSVTAQRTYQVSPAITLTSGYALYYDEVNGIRVMDTSGQILYSNA